MNRRVELVLVSLAIVVSSLVAYWPAFQADFVNFDDGAYVFDNLQVRNGLTGEGIVWAMTEVFAANWHPLTWISHMTDVSLFGLEPAGHHVVNWIFHAANAVVLFLLLTRVTGSMWASAGVALLFALHPLNVESVAWISERKNVLSTLLGLLSIWLYAVYVERRSLGMYVGSLALFALSLTSKQMLVTLPFALLLLDYWPLRRAPFNGPEDEPVAWPLLARGWLPLVKDKLPFLALTIGASLITLVAQQIAMAPLDQMPFGVRLANALVAYVEYLGMAVWPAGLAVFYPHPGSTVQVWMAIVAGITLLIVSSLAVVIGRTRRYVLVGWFWYLGTLVPVIGLVQVGSQSMADRYMYVPLIGIFVILAFGVRDLILALAPSPKLATVITAALLVGVSVPMAWKTYYQSEQWHDTMKLFAHAAEVTERNYLAHGVLAGAYLGEKKYQKAVEHCHKAIEYYPADFDARMILGGALMELQSTQQALRAYGDAMKLRPDDPAPMGQFGVVLANAGRNEVAQSYLQRAASLASNLPKHSPYSRKLFDRNWANVLARGKHYPEAMARYEEALKLDPNYGDALRESGEVLLEMGNLDEAVKRLRSAIRVDDKDERARALLGTVLARQGKFDEAIEQFNRALAIAPDVVDSQVQLGKALRAAGRLPEAEKQFLTALDTLNSQKNPKLSAEVCVQLGQLLIGRGETAEGLARLERALRDDPTSIEASNDVAWQLATSANPTKAEAQRAVQLASFACGRTQEREPAFLGTLSAAYAAAGDFTQAVAVAEKALSLAKADQRHAWIVEQLGRQLQLHQAGKPWLEQATP